MRPYSLAETWEESWGVPRNEKGGLTSLRQLERLPEIPITTWEELQDSCHNSSSWSKSSGQDWRSRGLEFRHLLIDRGLKTHSLSMPFIPLRNIGFPAFCVLRVTHSLKTLTCRSFFSSNFLWRCEGREGSHTHRERQNNINTSVPSHYFCRRDPLTLGLSGKFVDTAGTRHECELGYMNLVAKFTFLSQLVLKWCSIATTWKYIQLLFSYLWQW